jgi:hypothetical protein
MGDSYSNADASLAVVKTILAISSEDERHMYLTIVVSGTGLQKKKAFYASAFVLLYYFVLVFFRETHVLDDRRQRKRPAIKKKALLYLALFYLRQYLYFCTSHPPRDTCT